MNSEKVPVPLELGFYICIYFLLSPQKLIHSLGLYGTFIKSHFCSFIHLLLADPSPHPTPPHPHMCLYVYVFFILNEGQYSLCFCLSDCYPNHCKFECLKILALTNIFPSNFVFFVHLTAFLQGNELILPGLSDPSFMTLFCLHHSYFLLFKARAVSPVDSASPPQPPVFSSMFLYHSSNFSTSFSNSVSVSPQ